MLGELNEDFILSGDELDVNNLFSTEVQEEVGETPPVQKEQIEPEKEAIETPPVSPEDLFGDMEEDGEEENQDTNEREDTTDTKEEPSPNKNFYSSMASALKNDGIFPDFDDEAIKKTTKPEEFAELVENTIQSRLTERQQRIDKALSAEIEVNTIKQFENTLANLDSFKEEHIKDETEQGENLRKNLIYQDFINRGYSEERAKREITKSFNAGTDIEDAREALISNKEYFSSKYNELISESQEEVKLREVALKKEIESFRKTMLDDKEVFKGLTLDKNTRNKAYENITKPVFKTENGEYLTSIQKYERDNPVEFKKYLSVLFTMTDGFKNIDGLVKGKVKKEVRQHLKELEHTLSNTSRSSTGNPTFVGDSMDDKESYSGKGWTFDV